MLRTAVAALVLVAGLGLSEANAQMSTTVATGPGGTSVTRSIHRGRFTHSVTMSHGRFGRSCRTVRNSVRTGFGMRTRVIRRCN